MKQPSECTNIDEVRQAIDAIDKQVVALIGKRAQYVKEVVKYKKPDKESVVAAKRQEEVVRIRRAWAVENDLDPDVVEGIYRLLIDHFVDAEMKILNIE